MSEKVEHLDEHTSEQPKSKTPKKLIVLTLLVVIGLLLAHWQLFYLNQRFNISPDHLNVVTLFLPQLLFLMWLYWAFFIGKRPLVGLFILAIPVVFFTLYYPNIGGSANIIGWTPRFWKKPCGTKNGFDGSNEDRSGINNSHRFSTIPWR